MGDAHSTANERRQNVIKALSRELDPRNSHSSAMRLRAMLPETRSMIVGGDIDGLVSSMMLGSVAETFSTVAFVIQSEYALVHPDHVDGIPDNAFGVDIFSLEIDNVSNHVELFGDKMARNTHLREAFRRWDQAVRDHSASKLFAVPSLWAEIVGGYEDLGIANSSRYKYPLGTAQIMLALLESSGRGPRFFDRTYLPWLVANCDGGIDTFTRYADNARVWWPVMAGAVGPGTYTDQLFRMVETMRPHDFRDAVHRLDRERGDGARFLKDDWNLVGHSAGTLVQAIQWISNLTGWRDPVLGGSDGILTWPRLRLGGAKIPLRFPDSKSAQEESIAMAANVDRAHTALNANFHLGGHAGSRFNWAGAWSSAGEPPIG